MIAYLQGNISYISPTQVIIEAGGFGYQLNISLNTFSKIQKLKQVKLYTYLHISGGNMQGAIQVSIFGFADELEKQIFSELLGISGVGAATVRMILSSLTPEEIQKAIATENTHQLESIKGIGPKSAKRIILELKDKMSKGLPKTDALTMSGNNVREESLSALIMLGFNKQQAEQTVGILLRQSPEISVEELIKQSLKRL